MGGAFDVDCAITSERQDIDLVCVRDATHSTSQLLGELGYQENHRFGTLNAGRRALYYDPQNQRKLDLFVGEFEMCHSIPITDRLQLDPTTIPLAELMLTKLQIVQLNGKDVRDIVALLLDHEVADHDDDSINAQYIAKLCSDDWGLWRTCIARPSAARSPQHTDRSRAERRNRIHRQHRSERYAALSHLVLSFHDSTFECVATGYAY